MGCSASVETCAIPTTDVIEPQCFHARYALGECLGDGAFGEVRVARCSDADEAAVKIVLVRGARALGQVQHEYGVSKRLGSHPNIVELRGFCFEGTAAHGVAYLVMERCGETLRERLGLFARSAEPVPMQRSEIREACRGMLSALVHVHRHDVVHRDVKLDNVLTVGGSLSAVKLCDFGASALLPSCGYLREPAGTAAYMAPEVVQSERYGFAADVWSCGVCAYNVLFHDFPYRPRDGSAEAMREAIDEGEAPAFAPRARAPPPAVDLARALLARGAGSRPTAEAALRFQFFERKPSGDEATASEASTGCGSLESGTSDLRSLRLSL